MTAPTTSAFFESVAQVQSVATERLHLAMRGVNASNQPITPSEQMRLINEAQQVIQVVTAAANGWRKLLQVVERSA